MRDTNRIPFAEYMHNFVDSIKFASFLIRSFKTRTNRDIAESFHLADN